MVEPDRNPPSEPFSRTIPAGGAGRPPQPARKPSLVASYLALPKRTQLLFGTSLFISGLIGLYFSDKAEEQIRAKQAGQKSEKRL